MAKRLLAACLVVMLGLTIATSGVAVAAKPKAFTAQVQVAVTNPGLPTPTGARIKTEGEVITGIVDFSPDWDALAGASFEAHHSSNIFLNYMTGDITNGHAHGTAQLTKVDLAGNVSILEINYEAAISGNFRTGVRDSATWNLVRATGVFDGVQAHGALEGVIAPIMWIDGFPILGGTLTFSGTFG